MKKRACVFIHFYQKCELKAKAYGRNTENSLIIEQKQDFKQK